MTYKKLIDFLNKEGGKIKLQDGRIIRPTEFIFDFQRITHLPLDTEVKGAEFTIVF